MPVGDSKTANARYSQYLTPLLTEGIRVGVVRPGEVALGGWTTADLESNVDASLAAYSVDDAPRVILLNIGVNDWAVPRTNAQMITSLEYSIDAMHTKYPGARILIAVPWERTYDDRSDEFRSVIIPALLTGRESYLAQGMDEGVWMRGDDDGATWTSDGKHPTIPEGYEEAARQWYNSIAQYI